MIFNEFFLQKIKIKDNFNKSIGKVTEKFNLSRFSLKLRSNKTELQIYGPSCNGMLSYCWNDIHFNIYDKSVNSDSNESVGYICKLSDFTTNGHIFRVKLKKEWSPEIKSIVIGASILIDYYFFDNSFHERKYHSVSMSSAKTLPPFPLVDRYVCNDVDHNTEQTLNE